MGKFSIPPTSQWYTLKTALTLPTNSTIPLPSSAQVSDLYARSAQLYSDAILAYENSAASNALTSSSSDATFLKKILRSGTLSDRLSALTLVIQSSPLHNTKALEALKGMVERGKGQGGREQSLKALRCIVDWWVGGGAPSQKLKFFREQPLLHPDVTDEYLALWFFEDWLKKYFFSLLQILETLSLDPLTYVRTQTLTFISTLLRETPEQEQNLLRLLVNKLGDNERTICSRTSHYLLQILQAHPSMKSIVVREIIALVFRPAAPVVPVPTASSKHIRFGDAPAKVKGTQSSDKRKDFANIHAAYYATITFNQIVLSPSTEDREVARHLINVYFDLFKDLLGSADTVLNDEPSVAEHETPPARKGSMRQGKAGPKETRGSAGFAEVEDSNSRHISAILTGVNRALPFAKLSPSDAKFNQHVNTLFLITHTSTFNISLQALLLLFQIASSLDESSRAITDRYYRTLYSSLHDSRLAASSKQAMYLNLVFKSLKADKNLDRVAAFTRRFVQLLTAGGGGGPEFTAGGLYVLGELFSSISGLRKALSNSHKPGDATQAYDPRKRDPQYAHATVQPLWELTPLLYHYHPTVALHARQLLLSQPLTASADLSLNTLSHFLDRFVYKNPKKAKSKGSSAMQPAASSTDGTAVKLFKGEVADTEGLMNEAAFVRKNAEDVPADQLFFHHYFSRKNEKEKARVAKSGKSKAEDDLSEDDGGSLEAGEDNDDSDADEAAVWKAMKSTMPKVDGDDDIPADSDVDSDDDSNTGLDLNGTNSESEDGEAARGDDATSDEPDNDDSDLALGEEDDDLVDLDDVEIPEGLVEYDGSDASGGEEEWEGVRGTKRKRGEEEKSSSKKKKLRSLGTFASYEQYAQMIDDAEEEDL